MRLPNHTFAILTVLAVLSATWAAETSSGPTGTISGVVGMPDVTMQGLPGNPLTDDNGYYVAKVPRGWAGTVAPAKKGYEFDPPARAYNPVRRDFEREDFEPSIQTFIISGTTAVPGVLMRGLPGDPITDTQGDYRARVDYGWSGTITPEKPGYAFHPPQRTYGPVEETRETQDYAPVGLSVPPSQPYAAGMMDVLIVPDSEVDPKMLVEIREDMQVMVQILRETLSEPRMILGMLYDYGDIFGRHDRGARAFYLEGYGALFVIEVDFLFSFPAEADPEAAPEQEVDPVWQRARQKLRSPGARRAYGQGAGDEMSFEQFKADLVKTLKYAANIRHVDPNENIVLTIIGQDQSSGWSDYKGARGRSGAVAGSSYSYSGGSFGQGGGSTYANSYVYGGGPAAPGAQVPARDVYGDPKRGARGNDVHQSQSAPAPTTVLTIQARKADVDAFSASKIDDEQFQQRVKVFTY